MSIHLDEQDQLKSMIADFVLRQRQSGLCLSYQEYQVIEEWTHYSYDQSDRLMMILGDEIPRLYSQTASQKQPPKITRLRKKVLKRLKTL